MATLEQETILEWLNSHIEKKQLIAVEELCIALLIKSDNMHKCFESYPPSTFLPILLKFFLHEQTSENLLEVAARAITYYLDVSSECITIIVAIDGAIQAICKRLTLDSVSGVSKDLNEQCVKILDFLCARESKLICEAGALRFVIPCIREKSQQVHKDTLISAIKILSSMCNKRERFVAPLLHTVEALGAVLEHQQYGVVDASLRCFALIAEMFMKNPNNSDSVAEDVENVLHSGCINKEMEQLGCVKKSLGLQQLLTALVSMTTTDRKAFSQLMAVCSAIKPKKLKSLDLMMSLIKAVELHQNKPTSAFKFAPHLHYDSDKTVLTHIYNVILPTTCRIDQENEAKSYVTSFLSEISEINTGEADFVTLHQAAASGQLNVVKNLLRHGLDIDLKIGCKGFTPLYFAIGNNRLDMVKFLIALGANVNEKARFGLTPLNFASYLGYLDIVNALISNGADIHTKTEKLNTPLHLAAENGHLDVLNVLIEKGSDIDSANMVHARPLHSAIHNGNIDVIKTLIARGADVNAESRIIHQDAKVTPLHLAIQTGRVDIVKVLLKAGANVNAKTSLKVTPLHIAAQNGFLGLVNILLKAKCNVNCQNSDKETPLHLAAGLNHIGVIKFLLFVKGIDINVRDRYKCTALHYASQTGHLDVVKLLVDQKAQINDRQFKGYTPLHLAVQYKHVEVSDFLIQNGADVNSVDDNNWTPLHNAAYNGFSLKIVESLVAKGVDISAKTGDSRQALHLAAEFNQSHIIHFLIESEADLNAQDRRSWTPLHGAAFTGSLEATKCLLEHGADINEKTLSHDTALHFAADKNHLEVVELLLKKGADINARDYVHRVPLHFATEKGNHQIVTVLLKHGALIEAKECQDYATPLHLAALNGHARIVNTLISYGANVNAKSTENVTPLHLGAQAGKVNIVERLLNVGAHLNAKTTRGDGYVLPMHFGARARKVETVEFLGWIHMLFKAVNDNCYEGVEKWIKMGAVINSKTVAGKTPLHCAVTTGNMDIVNLLLKNGADATKLAKNSCTTLHLAVSQGHTRMVETLLQSVSQYKLSDFINVKTTAEGTTPLHLATENNFSEIVLCLLKHRAKYNIKNKEGQTPCELSQDRNVTKLLNLVDELFDNVKSGSMGIIDELMAFKAEEREAILNARNDEGKSLVQVAIINKRIKLASSLLEISGRF